MDFAPALLSALDSSKYALLFLGCYLEGPAVMLTAGILWHIGTVSFLPALTALYLGDILADIMWYTIGYHAGRPLVVKYGSIVGITDQIIDRIERRFHRHHTNILVVSKLTMGLGLAVPLLTVAGMLRIPFTRYLAINAAGGAILIPTIMLIGYYFGNVFSLIPHEFRILAAAIALIILAIGFHALTNRLSKIEWLED